MIDSYSFGHIVVDGRAYTSDILVYPDGHVVDTWRRITGHKLSLDDIWQLIQCEPQFIVGGTGAYGLMKPQKDLVEHLAQEGIEFHCAPSKKAVQFYNEISHTKQVAACFHLTC